MIKFDIDGKIIKLEDIGFKHILEISEPTIQEMDRNTIQIPEMIGELDFGEDIQGCTLSYTLLTNFKEKIYYHEALNNLKKVLLDEYGYPRYIKLIRDYEPDKYFWVKVIAGSIPKMGQSLKSFTLDFRSNEPFSYSIEEVNDVKWGSTLIDFRASYKLGHEGSGAVDLPVTGPISFMPILDGYAVQPYIILSGKADSISIRTGDSYITHNAFNGKLEIDTENYIAYINGVETMLQRFDEFYLIPNQKVYISGTNMNFKVTMHYRWKYI